MIKPVIERVLTAEPLLAMARRRTAGSGLILAYHNVIPDDGVPGLDRSLHIPISRFVRHLDALLQTHRVVHAHELPNALREGGDRPCAAITFDDAYRGALRLAVPALAERGLPATMFVPTGLLGGHTFWWDAAAIEGGRAREAFRMRALLEGEGDDDLVRQLAAREGVRMVDAPPAAVTGSESDLRVALQGHAHLVLGAHSATHPNLTRVADSRLEAELREGLDWLGAMPSDRTVPAISYPYGCVDGRVAAAAKRMGYGAGLLIAGGRLEVGQETLGIPRWNVPAGLSDRGFRLRVDGLLHR